MTVIFLKLLNMSVAAGWAVLAVLLLRGVCKKAPKWINCLLWGIVALRLVLPFTVESTLSLIPSAQVIPQDIAQSQTPAIYSGIPAVNSAVNPLLTAYIVPGSDTLAQILQIATAVWLIGLGVMLLYSLISYCALRRQVQVSMKLRENIYLCDGIDTPFVLGVFRPKIYVPSNLDAEQLPYVLAHEQAHIHRRDNWWKPVGFALLSIYWFNPLLWLAYILLCRDIEQACDEKVIAAMDPGDKKGYMEALAACATRQRLVTACPVAFGEVGAKERLRHILHYKKPAFWILIAAVVMCIAVAVCFLTSPLRCDHQYTSQLTTEATCTETGIKTHTCQLCKHSYTTVAPLLAHTFDVGVVTKQPTCLTEGEKQHSCTVCGAQATVTMEKTGHTAGQTLRIVEPNCTQTGQRFAQCTLCGVEFVAQELETNGVHDLQESVTKAATCTEGGEGVKKCSRCDYTENCTYAPTGHNYQQTQTLPATCANYGQQWYRCSNCAAEYSQQLPKTDAHKWVSPGFNWPDYCSVCWKQRSNSSRASSQSDYSLIDNTTYLGRPTYVNTGDPFSRMGTTSTGTTLPVIRIWP